MGLAAEVAVALVLGGWGAWSLRRRALARRGVGADPVGPVRADTRAAARVASGIGPLLAVALFFVAIVVGDPPFPAGVLASSAHGPALVVAGFVVWALVSQSPLVVVAAAVAAGVDAPVTDAGRRLLGRMAPLLGLLAAVAALMGAVVLLAWVAVRLLG